MKPMAAGLFYHGELPRIISRLLREHPDGLTLKSTVEMVCRQKGWDIDDTRFVREIRLKVSRTLDRKKLKGYIERLGNDAVGVWRIKPR